MKQPTLQYGVKFQNKAINYVNFNTHFLFYNLQINLLQMDKMCNKYKLKAEKCFDDKNGYFYDDEI